MKVVVTTIIILIIFLSGALYFTNYVQVQAERLIASIEELDQEIMAGNWEGGEEKLKKIKEEWQNAGRVFENLLEHYDLDAINISLAKIERYIDLQDLSLTIGEITQLREVVDLIKKKETFSLSNLL